MKKYIPNIITTYRLLVAFIIPFMFFYGNYLELSILFVTAILSDSIDGFLARRWNVSSNYGKVVDVIGDKALSLSTSSTFIIAIDKSFAITLILEILIIIINGIHFLKTKSIDSLKSSIYGKIKTWFLFSSLFIGLLSFKVDFFKNLVIPFIILTAIMQIVTAINYIKSSWNTKST